jgi:hypothetical protein
MTRSLITFSTILFLAAACSKENYMKRKLRGSGQWDIVSDHCEYYTNDLLDSITDNGENGHLMFGKYFYGRHISEQPTERFSGNWTFTNTVIRLKDLTENSDTVRTYSILEHTKKQLSLEWADTVSTWPDLKINIHTYQLIRKK